MERFKRLLEIADQLLGPNGCSWDREQTLFTLQPYLLEETHELIEAIDLSDFQKISEEIGDVLYALIFIAKLAELEGKFSIQDSIQEVSDKLVRRHPHVFGDVKVSSNEEIVKNWEEIKKKEKGQEGRKKLFDGIPPTLPALPKAQKMASKLRKKKLIETPSPKSEEEIADSLWDLVLIADAQGLDAESLLRRKLKAIEERE